MSLGAFWKTVINPDFDLARVLSLNCIPEAEQRAVFDKFGPESGRAFFELFFWMFDQTGATKVDTARRDLLGAPRPRPHAGAGAGRR